MDWISMSGTSDRICIKIWGIWRRDLDLFAIPVLLKKGFRVYLGSTHVIPSLD